MMIKNKRGDPRTASLIYKYILPAPAVFFPAIISSVIVVSVIIIPVRISFAFIPPMASFIIRTEVFIIDPVTIVPVPGRIGIIGCVGVGFISYRSRCIGFLAYGSGLVNYGDGYRYRQTVDPGKSDANMGVNIYLRITGSSYQAGGDDRREDK
jgi:hypothetical protein